MRKGLTLPNRVWERWTDQEVEAIIALQPQVVQVLVFHQQPADVKEVQRLQCWHIWGALASTNCRFQYRMMGWHDMAECAEAALILLLDYPEGSIIPFNEPNIPLEGWEGIDYIQAVKDFAVVYKMLGGDRQLIMPAMSPSADGYFSGTDAMTQLVRDGLYDYLGLHEYLNQIFTPVQVPVSITECNGKVPAQVFDYLSRLYPTAQEAVWFSSKWVGAEDPNYHWDLIGNEELSNSFKAWQGGAMTKFRIGAKWYDDLIEQLPMREGIGRYKRRGFGEIAEITIHHSGSDTYATTPMALATDMVQHQDPNRTKYPEIPYHIVIEPDGHITVVQPLDALTWHADGGYPRDGVGINNWRGVGICLIGDFTNHPPSVPQLIALSELCPEIDFAMGKKLGRVRHSDVQATACPGATSRGQGNWFDNLFSDIMPTIVPDKLAQIRAHAQAIIDLTL